MKYQLTFDNNSKLSKFDEIGEIIKASLRFQPKPWQIKRFFNIKQGLNTVIMTGTRSSKSLLFQTMSFIIKNLIVLLIIPTLTLIED